MDKIKESDLKLTELKKALQKAAYLMNELIKVNEVLRKYDIDLSDNFKVVSK